MYMQLVQLTSNLTLIWIPRFGSEAEVTGLMYNFSNIQFNFYELVEIIEFKSPDKLDERSMTMTRGVKS
jgi:hypothetical protein